MSAYRRWAFICATTLLGGSIPTWAPCDIYRYVDRNGVIHFTNAPSSPKFKFFMREEKRKLDALAERIKRFTPLIESAAKRHGVEFPLVKAVVKVESDFDPDAISKKGARGLMQLMPETAKILGVENIFDPEENLNGGAKHLRSLLDHFKGRRREALAAYNAGKDAVLKYKGIPPYPETQQYVKKVLKYYTAYTEEAE